MDKYRVAHLGLGPRGNTHVRGFLANSDRFELVALCDINEERLAQGARDFAPPAVYTDAEKMLSDTQPDVFCFATLPSVRLSLVELGVANGIKALAFEKPMATSLKEAWTITRLCRDHHVKAVVSHQQKYLTSMEKMKRIVDAGELGQVTQMNVTTLPWVSQLGTHYMDYMIWANGGARGKWAVGHVHGKKTLDNTHPSPDWLMGQVLFENGVRGTITCGYLSPSYMTPDKFWCDNRLTVYGSHGYAWADTNGRWGAFTRATRGEVVGEEGEDWPTQSQSRLQTLYMRDLADWLDDDAKVHPCNVDLAYHGYEILEAMCLSAMERTRVDLPLSDPGRSADILQRMREELPDVKPLVP